LSYPHHGVHAGRNDDDAERNQLGNKRICWGKKLVRYDTGQQRHEQKRMAENGDDARELYG